MPTTAGDVKTEIKKIYGRDVTYKELKLALNLPQDNVEKRTHIGSELDETVREAASFFNLTAPPAGPDPTPSVEPPAPSADPVSMTAEQMARAVSARTKPFNVNVRMVGQAIGQPRLRNRDPVTEPIDDVVAKLFEAKPSLREALEGMPESDDDELIGGELLPYAGNPFDELMRQQVTALAEAYRTKVEQLGDQPYRPEVKRSGSGTGYNFPNVFTGEDEFLSVERYRELRDKPKKSFPINKQPLLQAMAALVAQMSSVTHTCIDCLEEIFDDEIAIEKKMLQLLSGRRFLPGTPGIEDDMILRFTGYCGVCKDIRREIVKMEVELQHMQGEEAQARRSALYVDTATSIFHRHATRRPSLSPLIVGQRLRKLAEGGK